MPDSSTSNQQSALIAAYRQMRRFMVAADTGGLKPLLANGFSLVHMTGYVQPRDECLDQIDSGRMRYLSAQEEDVVVVTMESQHATLQGRSRVNASIWGAQGTWPLQLDIDFILVDGYWLMGHAVARTY